MKIDPVVLDCSELCFADSVQLLQVTKQNLNKWYSMNTFSLLLTCIKHHLLTSLFIACNNYSKIIKLCKPFYVYLFPIVSLWLGSQIALCNLYFWIKTNWLDSHNYFSQTTLGGINRKTTNQATLTMSKWSYYRQEFVDYSNTVFLVNSHREEFSYDITIVYLLSWGNFSRRRQNAEILL